jgi:hypothetical protein
MKRKVYIYITNQEREKRFIFILDQNGEPKKIAKIGMQQSMQQKNMETHATLHCTQLAVRFNLALW